MQPPVASVEGLCADEVDCARDVVPGALAHDEQDLIGHRLADPAEELAVQIGRAHLRLLVST